MTTQIEGVLERWEIIYGILKNKWKDGRHFADPEHMRNGFVELYNALEQANKRIKEQDDLLDVIDEALGKIELKAGNTERGAILLVEAYKQANERIVELKWLLQNEPPDDLGSYTQVMRQKWNKRRDKALAEQPIA